MMKFPFLNMAHLNSLSTKRDRESDDSDVDGLAPKKIILDDNWPHFLAVFVERERQHQFNPFLVSKSLQAIVGTPKSVKRVGFGFIVEVSRKQQAENLLGAKSLANIPVSVKADMQKNSCRGIIYCRDLRRMTDEEVLCGLQENNGSKHVTDVRRIRVRREGQLRDTDKFVVSFGMPERPERLVIGYEIALVDVYYDRPRRCFKCQRFGHTKTRCSGNVCCARCGKAHDEKDCHDSPHCVNCGGNHGAFSRDCPVFKEEQQIQRVKTDKGISFQEAARQVRGVKSASTYANVVRKVNCADAGTQTNVVWLKKDKAVVISDAVCCKTTQCGNVEKSKTGSSSQKLSSVDNNESQVSSQRSTSVRGRTMNRKDSSQSQSSSPFRSCSQSPCSLNRFAALENMDTDDLTAVAESKGLKPPLKPKPCPKSKKPAKT